MRLRGRTVSPSTLKYHYSHRFPTYSVERNARYRPRVRPAPSPSSSRAVVSSSVRPAFDRRAAGPTERLPVRPLCRAAVDIPVALSTSRGIRASNRGPAAVRAYDRPSKVAVRGRGSYRGPGPWCDPYSEDTARWGV